MDPKKGGAGGRGGPPLSLKNLKNLRNWNSELTPSWHALTPCGVGADPKASPPPPAPPAIS